MGNALDALKEFNPKPMKGQGTKKAKVLFVQENPFDYEYRKKRYMTGKSGKLLKFGLAEVGIDPDEDVYYTSIVKYPTPENRLPTPDELKESMDFMWAEIEVVDPDIIVPTGNLSLKFLTKMTAITKVRGKLYEIEGRKFFPMIHPNLVLKQPKYQDFFIKDLDNLAALLEGKKPKNVLAFKKERRYCDTFEEAIDEIKRYLELPAGSRVVIDLETVKTNPFIEKVTMKKTTLEMYPMSQQPKIVGIGLSDKSGYGCAIPLYHRENLMPGNQIGTIVKFLRKLLEREDLEFIAHNGKFDIRWLRASLDIQLQNLIWDTMLIHYLCITEEKNTHGLKDLAWLETDMGGYDDALDGEKPKGEDEGNYDLIPWDILKVYLADDCDVTYRLSEKYIPLVEENEEKKWLWENIMVPGYYTLLDIEMDGIYVDKEWLEVLRVSYEKEIARLEDKMREFPEVVAMEREKRDRWKERVMIGTIKPANRTPEQQEKFKTYKKYDPSKGGDKFSFGSHKQLGELLFDRMGLETVIFTDKGAPSTNDDSLKFMESQSDFVKVLMEFRKANHLYNNFVSKLSLMIDPDGIVHPSYNIHGTVTGRLSSNEPNAQQFPRKVNTPTLFQYNFEIKKLFTSRFGDDGVIVQFDYSQLELRILAVISQDPTLIELYRSGADLHKAVASDAFGVTIEEVSKDQRTASKKIQFGIVYQESARGLSEDLRAEGITMSEKECEVFIKKYFKRFPKVSKWIRDIKKHVKRHKYVKTLTGRTRNLPDIDSIDQSKANEAERQAVNTPIQGTGSDCTLMSLILINQWLRESGLRSRICITVHDSIVLDSPKDEVIEVAKKVKHIMENLGEYNEFYKFLGDVPILSEMEIGRNYGDAFEATIEDLEEHGVDGFIDMKEKEKLEKDMKYFTEIIDNGGSVPEYARIYWENVS
ncbi:DNA polymerase [Bacillus phage phi18]|nr:DNA polymerase [Bacillus phage phi18]